MAHHTQQVFSYVEVLLWALCWLSWIGSQFYLVQSCFSLPCDCLHIIDQPSLCKFLQVMDGYVELGMPLCCNVMLFWIKFSILSCVKAVPLHWVYTQRGWEKTMSQLPVKNIWVLSPQWGLTQSRNIQWCHTYKCWNAITICGHWLGSPFTYNSTIVPCNSQYKVMSSKPVF